MDNNLNTSHLSKDTAIVKAYETDPLVNTKISSGLYKMVSDAGLYALENFSSVKLNGLLYHGDSDQITNHDATKALADQSSNIKWISYPGVYHEGHNDIEKDNVLENLISWIKEQI
jgi:acylglycerol lipase